MRKVVAVLGVVALALFGGTPAAGAFHCQGRATPPERYEGRGQKDDVSGWKLHHDLDEGWVGMHYTDGYVYADASDPERVEVVAFVPWWPRYTAFRIVVHPEETPCAEFGKGHP